MNLEFIIRRKAAAAVNDPDVRMISPMWFVAVIGVSMIFVAMGVDGSGGRVAGAFLWSFAWLGLGILVGFLFGVPKVVQKADQVAHPTDGDYSQRVNTNLEQISDWLTKGIVGVTLVELQVIPGLIARAAAYAEPSLALGSDAGAPFAAALIIAFFVEGFLTGYLFTRLHLARLFRVADRGVTPVQRESVADAQVKPNANFGSIPTNVVRVAEKLAAMPFEKVQLEDVAIWAKAQLINGNLDEALVGYKRALQLHPGDSRLRLEYASVLFRAERSTEALREIDVLRSSASKGDAEFTEQVYAWATYICLYEDPPKGFEEAIRYGKEYVALGLKAVTGDVYVNLAAAYGQKAAALNALETPEAVDLRKAALEAVKSALACDKQWRTRLRQLTYAAEPGRKPDDTDLQPFAASPEFHAVLGSP